MTVTQAMVQMAEEDAVLMALMSPDSQQVYMQGSLGIGDHPAEPAKPYLMLSELPVTMHAAVRETSSAKTRQYQWWVYDEEGDYALIDRALKRIEDLVRINFPKMAEDGTTILDAVVTSWSGTLGDELYHASCKNLVVSVTCDE